jgi:hypothetical protein
VINSDQRLVICGKVERSSLVPRWKNLRALHPLGKPLCGRLWPHNVCLLLKMCLPYEETFKKLQSVRTVSDKEVANSNQNEGVDYQSCRLPWPFLSSWVGGKQSKTCTQFRWRSKSDLVSIRKQPTNQQFLNGSFNQPRITNQPTNLTTLFQLSMVNFGCLPKKHKTTIVFSWLIHFTTHGKRLKC